MDFRFSEEQTALRDLAREILEAEVTPERLKAVEAREDGFDRDIALDCLRNTTWLAAWRLAEERPAEQDARIAKFFAADAGSRITTATQHLHGGMGVDLDYPIHRYFLWAKALELGYGGATPQLLALSDAMARRGPGKDA